MKKQKVIIYGARDKGKRLKLRIDSIFDIVAFIDRDKAIAETMFDNVPIFNDVSKISTLEYDLIFTSQPTLDSHRDLNILHNIPYDKIISLINTDNANKQMLFAALANEIAYRNIPGSVAELGVDFGDTAKYISLFFPNRKFYLFDTFSGFDDNDIKFEKSHNLMNAALETFYNERTNTSDVLNKMFNKDDCIIKQGYFPESLNGLEDTFAFVHIDCDLYNPIVAALEYFYPRLSKGGIICVHDYFNHNYLGSRKAVRDFAKDHNISYIPNVHYEGVVIYK